MRLSALALVLALLSGCKTFPTPALSEDAMISSTVQIRAVVKGVVLGSKLPAETGWVGSGVVYRILDSGTAAPSSLILTANHVLDAPKVGSTVETDQGLVTITEVGFTVNTEDGRTCDLDVMALGETNTEDVATGLADCVAGTPAMIGGSEPPRGGHVYVSGHPAGFEVDLITDGYVGGWFGGYLAVSAPAWGGNSGGPVFYHGRVIGLLVRGSREYPFISLVTPLQPILDRIKATDELL